ncbi:MAG: hypothetical protein C0501_00640 [Isosphaera sp.]|nr:hypothetical protein [Isosphaera sp.]
MDPGPLVMGLRDAGAKFLAELRKQVSVRAAFWVRPEGGDWTLYVIPDLPEDDVYDALGEVHRAAAAVGDPDFDTYQVRLIGSDERLAKEVAEYRRRYPGRTRLYLSGWSFNGYPVDDAYLYPEDPAAGTPATSSSRARRRPA